MCDLFPDSDINHISFPLYKGVFVKKQQSRSVETRTLRHLIDLGHILKVVFMFGLNSQMLCGNGFEKSCMGMKKNEEFMETKTQ